MGDFSTHGTQKAMDSAATLAVNRFMERETAENLAALREKLASDQGHKDLGANI